MKRPFHNFPPLFKARPKLRVVNHRLNFLRINLKLELVLECSKYIKVSSIYSLMIGISKLYPFIGMTF